VFSAVFDVVDGDTARGHGVRVEPDAHGVELVCRRWPTAATPGTVDNRSTR
jgi:hypothetical protein